MMKIGKMNKKIAETALNRAGIYCEKCGRPGTDMALHHRKLKSRGGKDSPANLMVVHHECHNLGTDSIHSNPKIAEVKGWMVPSWADPADYPITLPDGSIVRFDDNGTYTRIE
jgi:hypothetical protein